MIDVVEIKDDAAGRITVTLTGEILEVLGVLLHGMPPAMAADLAAALTQRLERLAREPSIGG